jgi:hypothetical protein
MEIILRNTDILNTGVFVLNKERNEFSPFLNYNELYLTQEGNSSLKSEILRIINDAKSVLKLCSFIITDKEIFNALIKKAKESQIAIFVLTQLDQSKLKNDGTIADFITEDEIKEKPAQTHIKHIKKLYENGIHVRASLSAHAKFIVSDRNLGFITSANFTTPSLSYNTESGVYLDEVSSNGLDKLFDIIFLQGSAYKQFLGTRKKGKILVLQSETKIDSDLLPQPTQSNLRYTCESNSNSLLKDITRLVNEASEYIYLSAYSIVGLNELSDLIQALKSAIERKVSISVFCRGMNYRSDHLAGVSKLLELGCKIYADVYNHSKGIVNEKSGLIFTANIDGNHGLTNGFEVGYLLNEKQRKEFLDFHKRLIQTSFYVFVSQPTRNELFQTYIAYEILKGLRVPTFQPTLILSFKDVRNVNLDEFRNEIIFFGKSNEEEFIIVGNSHYTCHSVENTFTILENVKPRFDIDKYVLKFIELKLIYNS